MTDFLLSVPYVQAWLKPMALILLLPPVPLLLLILLGAGLQRRRPLLGRSLLGLGLLGLWMCFTEVGADSLQRGLLGSPQTLGRDQLDRLASAELAGDTAVLVLGAGIYRQVPEYGGPGLKPLTLERLRYGIWLARRCHLPLGFTGGVGWSAEGGAPPEARIAQQVASEEFGLPLRFLENAARDTRENASLSLPLLKQAGIRRIVLVTHAEHMTRAERAFRQAGGGQFEIWPAPVGARDPEAPYVLGDWLPSGGAFLQLRYVLYEWLGLRAGH